MKRSFRRAQTWLCTLALLATTACTQKARYADDPTIHPDLDVSVAWLKNKRDSVDMRLIFHNKSTYPLTFTGSSVRLSYDGRTAYHTADFVRTLLPGESDARTFVFRFEQLVERKGIATLTVDPLYKGGAGDDKTRQEVRRYLRRFELL